MAPTGPPIYGDFIVLYSPGEINMNFFGHFGHLDHLRCPITEKLEGRKKYMTA